MKITIELDLENPGHTDAINIIMVWKEIHSALFEFEFNFKNRFKHKDWTDEQWEVYNELYDWLIDNFKEATNALKMY